MMGRELGRRVGPYSRRKGRPKGFPAWVDAERIRLGLTIEELAAAAKISRRTLLYVLAGETRPQISTRRSILHYLRSQKVQLSSRHS